MKEGGFHIQKSKPKLHSQVEQNSDIAKCAVNNRHCIKT